MSRSVWLDARKASSLASRRALAICAVVVCALLSGAAGRARAEPPATEPPDLQPPVVIEESRPPYPADAQGAKGDVAVAATITPRGDVSTVELTKGVAPALDQAALKAAAGWRFHPALRDGVPIASRVQLLFHFEPPAPVAGQGPLSPNSSAVSFLPDSPHPARPTTPSNDKASLAARNAQTARNGRVELPISPTDIDAAEYGPSERICVPN